MRNFIGYFPVCGCLSVSCTFLVKVHIIADSTQDMLVQNCFTCRDANLGLLLIVVSRGMGHMFLHPSGLPEGSGNHQAGHWERAICIAPAVRMPGWAL